MSVLFVCFDQVSTRVGASGGYAEEHDVTSLEVVREERVRQACIGLVAYDTCGATGIRMTRGAYVETYQPEAF